MKTQTQGIQCSHCHAYFNPKTVKGAVHIASCTKYNGHTNYETWVVSLWLDNDQGTYTYWREAARETEAERESFVPFHAGQEFDAVYLLSKRLQSEIEEETPTVNGIFADLLNSALSEVDWYSIAESILNEVKENT